MIRTEVQTVIPRAVVMAIDDNLGRSELKRILNSDTINSLRDPPIYDRVIHLRPAKTFIANQDLSRIRMEIKQKNYRSQVTAPSRRVAGLMSLLDAKDWLRTQAL